MGCRVKPGNDGVQDRSRDAIRTRVIVTRSNKATNLSPSAPIFARECRRWGPVASRSLLRATMDERRIRKRNAERRGSVPTAPLDAARALQSALAIRRSTTALCQWDYSSQGSTWARLRDTSGQTRRVPRQPVWHFQRCTSRAGHSAGRLMPRPPGSGSDEPPPAGTASRSDQPASPADVLHGERD